MSQKKACWLGCCMSPGRQDRIHGVPWGQQRACGWHSAVHFCVDSVSCVLNMHDLDN